MGAQLGQGWLFGRPGPLSPPLPVTGCRLRISAVSAVSAVSEAEDDGSTPFELLTSTRTVRRSSKRLLLKISRLLEEQALAAGEAPVVLTTFQDALNFTPATAGRYERLARRTAFVGAIGADLASCRSPGSGERRSMRPSA